MRARNKALADAPIRVEGLLARSAIASTSTDHGMAVRHLVDAVTLLEEHPASRTRDLWLAEALTRAGDAWRLAGRYPEAGKALDQVFGLPHLPGLNRLGSVRFEGHRTKQGVFQFITHARWNLKVDAHGQDRSADEISRSGGHRDVHDFAVAEAQVA